MQDKLGVVRWLCLAALILLLASSPWAENSAGEPGRRSGKKNPLNNVYFGEQHLHTSASPFSSFDSIYPEDLWTYQEIQRNLGHENFAIPHNGNVSDGWMYAPNTFLGGPMDARYAGRQALNEPLTEIIQTKGSSDTHPLLSPNDEFAEFEIYPNLLNVGQPGQIKYSYIRQGLVEGMILEEKLGSNPFKMGIVSGADSHSAYSNNEEFNFYGSHGAVGDSQLSVVWTDPDFDAKQKAVYYVRVLEIPTPRWSTYDAVRNNLPLSDHLPATLQERAWSSPIWYTPAATQTAKK